MECSLSLLAAFLLFALLYRDLAPMAVAVSANPEFSREQQRAAAAESPPPRARRQEALAELAQEQAHSKHAHFNITSSPCMPNMRTQNDAPR